MMEAANYVARLNEYSQKTRSKLRYEEIGFVGPDHDRVFTMRAVVDGKIYPDGVGKTKKEAKQNAAKNALTRLLAKDNQDSDNSREFVCYSDKTRSLSVTSDNSFTEINYIGIVNHYCQKTSSSHKYIEERRCGPPHNPQFFYKLVINNKKYPEAEGKSIKEAKQNAAQLAWSALQEQSDWDSKVSVRSTVSEDGGPLMSAQSSTLDSYDSSSQSSSMSKSSSIIFVDSSNPSSAQVSFRSTAPEDDAPSRESLSSSQSLSSSGIFSDSLNSTKDKDVVKNKITGNSQTSTQSRFTSDYDPLRCLGRGSYGCVYKVKQKLLDKYYAVKIVCWEEKSLREVGTLSDLHHRNIVRYYTFWMEDSKYEGNNSHDSWSYSRSTDNSPAKYLYIQMELCDTKTLKAWIAEKNSLNKPLQDSKRREESLSIAQQIISGVEYIHSKEHIHRDLKPENILFGLDGAVKIGDFGLVTRDGASMDRTVDRGTPTYRAPEQEKAKRYDRKVDIFPLGLIYIELLWKVSTGFERGHVLLNARHQKFPKEFEQIFLQEKEIIKPMLCEKPEGRPEASSLKAELEKWAQKFSDQKRRQENLTICPTQNGGYQWALPPSSAYQPTPSKCKRESTAAMCRKASSLSEIYKKERKKKKKKKKKKTTLELHWSFIGIGKLFERSSITDPSLKYLYIQLELCCTVTLRLWIDEKNVKSKLRDSERSEESLTIVKQTVSGVEYIHSMNLIHRDLKPANIMFGPNGEVKIGDFGLVTAEKDDDAENLLVRTLDKGTPSYMAPEQCDHQGELWLCAAQGCSQCDCRLQASSASWVKKVYSQRGHPSDKQLTVYGFHIIEAAENVDLPSSAVACNPSFEVTSSPSSSIHPPHPPPDTQVTRPAVAMVTSHNQSQDEERRFNHLAAVLLNGGGKGRKCPMTAAAQNSMINTAAVVKSKASATSYQSLQVGVDLLLAPPTLPAFISYSSPPSVPVPVPPPVVLPTLHFSEPLCHPVPPTPAPRLQNCPWALLVPTPLKRLVTQASSGPRIWKLLIEEERSLARSQPR
ncbi:uncharacterized protein ABDE67_014316 [Symphorus nematophorus]